MRTRLAKILLVLMTLSGIIMPMHAYAHDLVDSHDMHSTAFDTQHHDDSEKISNDHCSHFSSHSLGILRTNSNFSIKEIKSSLSFMAKIYMSYRQAPPYHPPII